MSSKIVLRFDLSKTTFFSDEEKELLIKNLNNKLNKENILIITCEKSRSQHKNKGIAIEKFLEIITTALKVKKKRKVSKPNKKSIKKRLDKKANRRKNYDF